MDKQATLGFVLIFLVLFVWIYFFSPKPEPQPVKQQDSTIVQRTDSVQIQQQPQVQQQQTETAQDTTTLGRSFAQTGSEKIVTVENDLVKMEFTSKGGRIRRVYMKKYETWYAKNDSGFYYNHVQLVNSKVDGGDLSLVFLSKQGRKINTASANFELEGNNTYYNLSKTDTLTLSFVFRVDDDSYIQKNYIFKGQEYTTQLDVIFNNMNEYITGGKYDLVWNNGINFAEGNTVDESNYANASVYAGDEQVVINSDGDVEKKEIRGIFDWAAVRSKYFAVVVSPLKENDEHSIYIEGELKRFKNSGVAERYSLQISNPLTQENQQVDSYILYTGPIDYGILKSYGKNFEKLYDFGSLFGLKFIIRPISEYVLLPLFKFLHMFIPNYGFVIIVFALIIKFALYPLTKGQMKSMQKMQKLQPKIQEIKAKYKDDMQKQQSETMKLYSTYGINPLGGGCLPLLLQMPIFVALWSLFNVAIELRQQPFILWIQNLSAPDVIMNMPFSLPLLGLSQVSGLAVLMGITMFIQQKMSIKDPSQKALVYVMPVMFTLMFMALPAGLNLYYFMFNLFSILQQWYVNHQHKDVELVPVKNPKKGGFMAKIMEAAENQQKIQQESAKKKKK